MAESPASTGKKRHGKKGKGAAANNAETHASACRGRPLTTFSTPSLDKKGLMQVALRQSMTGGSFIDTKFYAFSRRRSTGVVDEPLPVYANSAMLRTSSKYFDGFFDAGFAEARLTSLSGTFPEDQRNYAEEYDYDSDSDLEDEFELDPGTKSDNVEENGISKGKDAAVTAERIQSHHDKLADVKSKSETPIDASLGGEKYGRVIVIPDMAFTTWKAFIFYIYTGEIDFAPLKSQIIKPDKHPATQTPISAPPCSPKSMYRLADKCGFDELKEKAFTDIRSKLSPENIVVELRSSLTSTYDKIREMEVAFACEAAQMPTVLAGVPEWISDLVQGISGLTAGTLAALFQKAAAPASAANLNANLNGRRCANCSRHNTLNMNAIYRYCNSCGAYSIPSN